MAHHAPARALLAWALAATLLLHAGAPFAAESQSKSGAKPRSAGVLLVAGGSGRTGREVVRAAQGRQFVVRATTRDAEKARREIGALEWHEVDVRDAGSIAPAMRGVEYVVCAIGASTWEGPESPQFIDYQGVVNLVDAAKAGGVKHFVLISSASAGSHRDQTKNPRLGNILLWKTKAEEHLKASGLPYTIIGPAGLTDDAPGERGLRAVRRENYQSSYVSRGDVARVAVDALTNTAALRKSFALYNDGGVGPEVWRADLEAMASDAGTPPRAASPLDSLAWLAGHWVAEREGRTSEELWLAPRGGTMLAVNRETSASGKVSFEYLRIEARDGGAIVYLASPAGRAPPTEFQLTESGAERAVFENPAHDFPRKLTYSREGIVLRARAEGLEEGKPQVIDYVWRLAGSK